jgi:hypothetical protein
MKIVPVVTGRRSKIKAFKLCSKRWLFICRVRSTFRPLKESIRETQEIEPREANATAPFSAWFSIDG